MATSVMSRQPIPKTSLKLLELVHEQAALVTSPGYDDPKLEYELLNNLWEKIKIYVGYYKDRSFDLNRQQQEMYRNTEHYMKLLELMVING